MARLQGQRGQRTKGGILFELLFTVFLVLSGAVLWMAWNEWRADEPAHKTDDVAAVRGVSSGNPDDRSVWLQNGVRDLLLEAGVAEKDLLRSYTVERGEGESAWPEIVMEIQTPPDFRRTGFRQKIDRLLGQKGLFIRQERKNRGEWLLEMGEDRRTFMRLIFYEEG